MVGRSVGGEGLAGWSRLLLMADRRAETGPASLCHAGGLSVGWHCQY